MATRLLALVVAIGLVAGALLLRGALDGGDEPDDGSAATTTAAPSTTAVAPLRVVCASELAAACDALRANGASTAVVPAGDTAAELSGGTADEPDVWLTLAAWPEIVDDARQRADLAPILGERIVLGSSPLVLVGRSERMAALAERCGGAPDAITWRCIGDVAGAPWEQVAATAEPAWGQVKPSHASPVDAAAGLLVFSSAVVSYFGRSDVSRIDFETDDDFQAWVARLEQAIPTFGDSQTTPLDRLLLLPEVDVVGTTEAEATTKAPPDRYTVTYPAPMGRADAVAVSGEPLDPDVVATVTDALAAAGWGAPEQGDDGLPSPGAMVALQQLWQEVVR
jgi:hypothetical protein